MGKPEHFEGVADTTTWLARTAAGCAVVSKERDADLLNEIERLVGDYIGRRGSRVMDVLQGVARVMGDKAQVKGDDFQTASDAIEACAEVCNLRYDNEKPASYW